MKLAARCFLTLGSLGVVGLAIACGAPAETDATAIAKTDTAYTITPILQLTPALDKVTGAPFDDGATCGPATVDPPTYLADYGCSWGVAVLQDPFFTPPAPPVISPTGQSVQAYVWACLAVSKTGSVPIQTALDQIVTTTPASLGGPTGVLTNPSAFGGPPVVANLEIVSTGVFTDSCVGSADQAYVLVWENFSAKPIIILPGGCEGNNCGDPIGGGSSGGTGSSGIINGGIGAFQM